MWKFQVLGLELGCVKPAIIGLLRAEVVDEEVIRNATDILFNTHFRCFAFSEFLFWGSNAHTGIFFYINRMLHSTWVVSCVFIRGHCNGPHYCRFLNTDFFLISKACSN